MDDVDDRADNETVEGQQRGDEGVARTSEGSASSPPAAPVPDERALGELCERYRGFVDRMLQRSDINPASAESLRQEVLMTFMKEARKKKRVPDSIPAMLVTITGHQVCNYLRRRARRPKRADVAELDEIPAGETDAEEKRIRGEQHQLLALLMVHLSDDARRLITWIDLAGLDYDYVMQAMNIPLETARTRHRRAREKLKDLMVGFYAELEAEARGEPKQEPKAPRRR